MTNAGADVHERIPVTGGDTSRNGMVEVDTFQDGVVYLEVIDESVSGRAAVLRAIAVLTADEAQAVIAALTAGIESLKFEETR